MRALVQFHSWVAERRDEVSGCAEGRCPHRAEGISCELETRFREDFDAIEPHVLDDARSAVALARQYERGREPYEWSRETLELVRIARAEIADHEADEMERAIKERGRK